MVARKQANQQQAKYDKRQFNHYGGSTPVSK